MRILQDALTQQQGAWLYGGAPFSGLVYQLAGQQLVGQKRLWNGEVVANDNDWLSSAPLRVLTQALAEVDEPEDEEGAIYYRGEPFTGLSLSFYDGKLDTEELIIGGEKTGISRRWHENGVLAFVEFAYGNREHLSWYPDGRPKAIDNDQFTLGFDENGSLRRLSLRSSVDVTGYLPTNVPASRILVISGDVDIDILSKIDMTPVEELTLRNLSWGPEALDKLGAPAEIATKNTEGLDDHLAGFCDQRGCLWVREEF